MCGLRSPSREACCFALRPTRVEALPHLLYSRTQYDGRVYGGAYGDLAASVAATLLHPEARDPPGAATGALREPLVKVVHALRALEAGEVVLQDLAESISQAPYQSPTVFNFYKPDFRPRGFAHPAPEFEIFTAPSVIGLLNGLLSLVEHGVSSCDDGFGETCPGSRPGFASDELGEMALLLTGGRAALLDPQRRKHNCLRIEF